MGIPKIIWQTWKTHDVPDKWKESSVSIKKWASDWKYYLTDDQDNLRFVQMEYPEYLSLYQSFDKEIYRADMIRYLLLFKYGGLYMDLDLKLKCSLNSLFKDDADLYLVRTPNWNGYTNSFMASNPGCRFWLKCIEEIAHRKISKPWYIQGDLKVLWTTGPGMISEVIKEYDQPFMTIPYLLAHPCNICDHYLNRSCFDSRSYVEELEGGSWSGPMAKVTHFLICQWKFILAFLIVLFLVIVLLLILWKTRSQVIQSNSLISNGWTSKYKLR